MRKKKQYPKIKKINQNELKDLIERARNNTLTSEDCDNIQAMAETIGFILDKLNKKDFQLKRLLKQIFGIKTEKSKKVLKNHPSDASDDDETAKDHEAEEKTPTGPKKKRKGHGRNRAEAYTGAERIFISHAILKNGCSCPECQKGKVYVEKKPGVFVHIEGQPPLKATVYELEKLRCNLCGVTFEAELPINAPINNNKRKHYDQSAKSMLGILRYGYGLPLNRLANLQANLGIPLPASTGWDKSEEAANKIYPAFEELKRQGAQGDIIHSDDTGIKILKVMQEIGEEVEKANGKKTRTGIFTTGIVSLVGDHKIALFFTGRKHAGENFKELLENRNSGQGPPIQMCDAKKGNSNEDSGAIVANCNSHARRYFVDVAENFPDECSYVIIDVYKEIYKNDAITKDKKMSPDERLLFHQEKSGPIMEAFYFWLNDQFEQNLVEPNSGLGQAISYVINHWPKLTQFLHVPGAPLDNNICEQTLKMCIRHRKNSLFYKTMHGAYIGDMFMSLIHTCNFNGVNPFNYITQLQRHSSEVFKTPSRWMPWNYKENFSSSQINLESVSNQAEHHY